MIPPARRDATGSLPIAAYGMLSDCNSAALVGTDGAIDWFCVPRYDSPAVFARLLDPEAGHWSITPAGAYTVARRYLPGTLVLETMFTTDAGSVRLLDALSLADGQRGHQLGVQAPHELLRVVEGVAGSVELVMEFAPRPEYGLVHPLLRVTGDGARTFGGPNAVVLRAGVEVHAEQSTARARWRVSAADRIGFSLGWAPPESAGATPVSPASVPARIRDVCEAWRSWEAQHDVYGGAHRELVRFSSRVLKGLTYRPTGAVIAAPTTSLPEAVGGERNWDYRYAWIRDASLTLEALFTGACSDEAENFVSFMTSSAGGGPGIDRSLQIMYGVGGEHDLSERELGHLRGWRDSRPVRVGNGAWQQTQLDVYGELLNSLHLYRERLGELHPEIQHFAAELADAAARRWREPDAGMWEMRGQPRHHLSSKVLCWTALDRAVELAPHLGAHAKASEWAAERDAVRAAVLKRGWSDERGAYAQSFDSDDLDAAALLMPLVGFLPATDGRMRATIEVLARELTDDGLVLRYRNTQGLNTDGLTGEEGTFVICSFWLVACLAQSGETARASALFDRIHGYANDIGLLAEEIDTRTGELLGNVPQAFSHVGLIIAASALDKAARVPGADMPDPHRLRRFEIAQDQDDTYARALAELRGGRKESHWMWFIFPQISGLGQSSMSRTYAISTLAEAQAYVGHPVLGPRLIESARILTQLSGRTAEEIFGTTDAMKLRSSMTLFVRAAPDDVLFRQILDVYFGGVADELTESRLGSDSLPA